MRLTRRALLAGAPLLAAAGKLPLAAVPIDRLSTRWWRERHEQKLAELRHGPVELIFLGDSITQNWEKTGPEAWANFQPSWRQFYGDRHAVNLGFSGDATSHLLWRIEHGELDGIAPKAAVILIGANNLGNVHWSASDTVVGIATVVAETRRRLPRTKLLLLAVLPSDRSAWATAATLEINRALAARFSHDAGLSYMDLAPLFLRNGVVDPGQFYDPLQQPPAAPLHPTAQAQARMAAAIEPTLARLLNDRNHG